MPAAKARRLLRTVECAVDLDRGDLPARMGQFARMREARRVEDPPPPRIEPPARPRADFPPGAHQKLGAGTVPRRLSLLGSPPTRNLLPRGSSSQRAPPAVLS